MEIEIVNEVHNHAMEPTLEGHMLTGRLKEDDKKIVRDLPKARCIQEYFVKFEEKKTRLHNKYQVERERARTRVREKKNFGEGEKGRDSRGWRKSESKARIVLN
ncbi:hypothetical protein MTR_1g043340 [Medicago truncatula]|uniref:Uncharacterized protein n=1 Tax=Medicago truncatula TaxID=3880 RepID=G7I5D8_MEDTR|nr:hypothetical protein MTR_1g043340 [Medicago truncatula]